MAAKKKAKESEVRTFEEAMEELESLVEAMEGDQLPLEQLVAHYEQGAELLQHCEKVLAAAKQRIEMIEVGNSPEKNLAPNSEEVEDSPAASDGPTAESPEDDIRLL
ncbi:MAG TPA: exodeoxyribonuclease VII small subunit [Verrucomicrobiales bacterium]|nr:exodeoxyribonuclease VII small subunit [Roseibacillus sp.]HBM78096.1 exodeoxyribonuclease VII small subunit [Verrucomicrobiales bacterium]HCQ38302.1 exodeoxyribonuclease VII small subunit [Verrucomicrobiales bacterium]|tara:strand:- start:1984 stop:2304 length:321 start_codon:yes stop_codon:yes gene_type:complete